jgi:hypothetical protein
MTVYKLVFISIELREFIQNALLLKANNPKLRNEQRLDGEYLVPSRIEDVS